MNVFEDQLTRDLAQAAAALHLPPTHVAIPMRLARRRQIRRRRAGAIATILALTGITAGIVTVANRPSGPQRISIGNSGSDSDNPSSDETVPGAVTPSPDVIAANLEPSPLTWHRSDSNVHLAAAQSTVAFDTATGDLYAVSTKAAAQAAGGIATVAQRSSDGITWSELGTIADARVLRNLAAYNGSLYNVGTAAITQPIRNGDDWGDIVTRTSQGGSEWTTALLPGIDLRAIRDKFGGAFTQTLGVAAGPKGALIAEQVGAFLSSEIINRLPADSHPELGYNTVSEGIRTFSPTCPENFNYVYSPPPSDQPDGASVGPTCVHVDGQRADMVELTPSRVVTWADLGVSVEDASLYSTEVRLFLATDGTTFSPVTLPSAPSGIVERADLVADADGFVVIVTDSTLAANGSTDQTRVSTYTSPNGLTWTTAPPIENVQRVMDAARVDGVLEIVADVSPTGPTVAHLIGNHWELAPLGDMLQRGINAADYLSTQAATIGPAGIAIALTAAPVDLPLAEAPRVVRHDAFAVVAVNMSGTRVVVDNNGAEVGRIAQQGSSASTTDGLVLMDFDGSLRVLNADGTLADRFTYTEIDGGWQELMNRYGGPPPPVTDGPSPTDAAVATTPQLSYPDTNPFPSPFSSMGPTVTYVAFSRDSGVTWSITPLDDLAGKHVSFINALTVTRDAVVVHVTAPDVTPEHPMTKVFRGTF